MTVLNLFYEEPDSDRWLPLDRHARKAIRRLLRGKPRPGGQARVFLNLRAGLDRIGVGYRVNDYGHVRRHPRELACVIGKPFVLDKIVWENPILFGAAVYSHPIDAPSLLDRLPIRKILVPGPWMKVMCEPYWGKAVEAWPVGIDTELWRPAPRVTKKIDVLLYDKVRWEHEGYETSLIEPIRRILRNTERSFTEIRYGHYREEVFLEMLTQCRTMIFLCEHETQGIAYQQALSCGVPILAWDRGGAWRDPTYFPDKVDFSPVTSVPYWDERCGRRFADAKDFAAEWHEFWEGAQSIRYRPRDFVLENLTLEKSAREYVDFARRILEGPND